MGQQIPEASNVFPNGTPISGRFVNIEPKRHRVTLPTEVEQVVPWLKTDPKQSHELLTTLSSYGGVQLAPRNARFARALDKLLKEIRDSPPTPDDVNSPAVRLGAFFATAWIVHCHFEPSSNRHRLTFPKQMIDAKVLPETGSVAVVAISAVLIVCETKEWLEHNRGLKIENLADEISYDDD